jgi:hypothetical protein
VETAFLGVPRRWLAVAFSPRQGLKQPTSIGTLTPSWVSHRGFPLSQHVRTRARAAGLE